MPLCSRNGIATRGHLPRSTALSRLPHSRDSVRGEKLGSWGLGCCPTTRPTWRREDLRCSVARMETFLPTKKLEFLIVLGADRWSSSLKIARVALFR